MAPSRAPIAARRSRCSHGARLSISTRGFSPPALLRNSLAKGPDALFDEAVAAFQRGDTEAAERLCRSVLAANENHVGALHALGVLALERSDFANAESHLTRALALNPNLAATHNARGNALLGLSRVEEALT